MPLSAPSPGQTRRLLDQGASAARVAATGADRSASLAFFGALLGALVSPWFFIDPGFAGAGLMVAGIAGFCGMARILMKAPWSRSIYRQPQSAQVV